MRLIRAELSRFSSRRFTQIMLVGLVIAFGLTVFTVMASSERATDQMWAVAEAQAQEQRQYLAIEYNRCVEAITDDRNCQHLHPSQIRTENFLYGVFHFEREIEPLLFFLAAFLSLFGYLVMASFIGSEMHSGGITNLLLWRPQRYAVLGSKLGVGLAAVGAISVVFSAIYVATFYGIATWTGYAGGVTAEDWADITVITLRAIGLALVASTVSFAIATVGRHTAAALGGLLGYVIVWEGGARLIAELVRQGGDGATEPFFLSTYIVAWFAGEYRYWVDYSFAFGDTTHVIYWWQSAVLFAVLAVATSAVAFVNFRKRDLM